MKNTDLSLDTAIQSTILMSAMMNSCTLVLAGRVLAIAPRLVIAPCLAIVPFQDIGRIPKWDTAGLELEVQVTAAQVTEVQLMEVQPMEVHRTLLLYRQDFLQHHILPASPVPIRGALAVPWGESLSPAPIMGFRCQQVLRMEVVL